MEISNKDLPDRGKSKKTRLFLFTLILVTEYPSCPISHPPFELCLSPRRTPPPKSSKSSNWSSNLTCRNGAVSPASASRVRPRTAGMTVTLPAGRRRWPIGHPGPIASGTAPPMPCRGVSLIWRWKCRNSRRANWRCALPIRKAILFQRLRSNASSNPAI